MLTFDGFADEAERKTYEGSVPSTSDNTTEPSFLNLGGANLDFPELKAIDDLLSDSFFSLTGLEESSTKETDDKSSKSSPFTLKSDELLAENKDAGDQQTLFSQSSSSSSVSSAPLPGQSNSCGWPWRCTRRSAGGRT